MDCEGGYIYSWDATCPQKQHLRRERSRYFCDLKVMTGWQDDENSIDSNTISAWLFIMLKLRTCIFISFVVLFCRPARPAKDGAHTLDVDLLSDGFFGLRDYEVFDVIEEGQEDVVYLRKRTDDDCDDTDCLAYSAWTKDSVMECSDDEDSGNDENDGDQGQNILGKRNGKSSDFCKGVDIETPGYDPKVKTRTGFTLESRNVLTPAKVEEVRNLYPTTIHATSTFTYNSCLNVQSVLCLFPTGLTVLTYRNTNECMTSEILQNPTMQPGTKSQDARSGGQQTHPE